MENIYCLGSMCDFGLFAVFGIISLQLLPVSAYPLGLEARGLGIHQRQPSYLPTYNGIFSIHALNFTPSAVEKTENYLPLDSQDTSINPPSSNASFENFNESPTFLEETDGPAKGQLNQEEGTDINEVDSEKEVDDNRQDPSDEPSTFPQIQVVTKTIGNPTSPQEPLTTAAETSSSERVTTRVDTATTSSIPALEQALKLLPANDSESLLAGSDDDPVEAGEEHDIFDNLMKTIQGHWLDFVGKMKLSVLDVWKSISQHMMDRLESFASAL